jgi:hypothetical protein
MHFAAELLVPTPTPAGLQWYQLSINASYDDVLFGGRVRGAPKNNDSEHSLTSIGGVKATEATVRLQRP